MEEITAACNDLRDDIEAIKMRVQVLRTSPQTPGEAGANATLAYRHLEDARMRLGKVIQALDGGVSCYDKEDKTRTHHPA